MKHKEYLGTIVTLLIIFLILGIALNECSWTYMPFMRIIFHAVAAVILSMLLNFGGKFWAEMSRELMGIWVNIICLSFIPRSKKILRKIRKIVNLFFIIIHPFIGPCLYIIYSFEWESYQAVLYERSIQIEQLTTDIIFSILGGIIWARLFGNWMKSYYHLGVRESKLEVSYLLKDLQRHLKEEEYSDKVIEVLQTIILILILAIPVLIILSAILIGWTVMKSLSEGWLWFLNF